MTRRGEYPYVYIHTYVPHLRIPTTLQSSSSLRVFNWVIFSHNFLLSSRWCSLYSAKSVLNMDGSSIGCSQLGSVPKLFFWEVVLRNPLRDLSRRLSCDLGFPVRSSSSLDISVGQCNLVIREVWLRDKYFKITFVSYEHVIYTLLEDRGSTAAGIFRGYKVSRKCL